MDVKKKMIIDFLKRKDVRITDFITNLDGSGRSKNSFPKDDGHFHFIVQCKIKK